MAPKKRNLLFFLAVMRVTFRFQAKKAFLTYSQCDTMTKEDVYYTLNERYGLKRYMIAEELHADEGRHLHCFLEFDRKLNCRRIDAFDINTGEDQYHPNIKVVQRGQENEDNVLKYIQKEDPAPLTNICPRKTWGEMRDEANDADDWLAMVDKYYPKEAANNWERLQYYANQRFKEKDIMSFDDFQPHEGWVCPNELENVQDEALKNILVYGPAGCGKTTWALTFAQKPTLLVTHIDGLKRLKPHHKSIIFDDMDFQHIPTQGQKFLVDREQPREIHIRYRTVIIQKGVQKIFTNNKYPFLNDMSEDANAISRRLNVIIIR